ncbi:hypothetical protein A3728_18495 [Sulfitobacter sp. HI0040]|nr:hypothetical protein A3721_15070 [Sulfitobacter sp. HI0023]KZY25598.1 hypothetical protein A3728_18495 [Sulfitobacter sp. HI0040]KZZ68852.1 hypothetical protein A3764_12135 [Sulfitobacter sp. HI0129]
MMPGSVRREGDEAVIRFPISDLHTYRVVFAPCPCKATKSNATTELRTRIDKALARLEAGK